MLLICFFFRLCALAHNSVHYTLTSTSVPNTHNMTYCRISPLNMTQRLHKKVPYYDNMSVPLFSLLFLILSTASFLCPTSHFFITTHWHCSPVSFAKIRHTLINNKYKTLKKVYSIQLISSYHPLILLFGHIIELIPYHHVAFSISITYL